MYSLLLIYTLIPLIFSHFFARLWADFVITNGIGNFESVKVHLFLFLIVFAIAEIALFLSQKKWYHQKNTWWKILLSIILFLGISFLIYPHENISNLLLWIWEKQHGILFVIGLVFLASILPILNQKWRKKLTYIIIGTGICISLIAIMEVFLDYNIFTGLSFLVRGSWGDSRGTATLGNPNYVAGYLLMILPLVLGNVVRFEKYILALLLFLGILATKSVIGITLASFFLLYFATKRIFDKRDFLIFLLIIISISLWVYLNYHDSGKWLSLTSRFILMKHTFLGYIHGPFPSFLFWNGPDGIVEFFSWERNMEITAYFPANMIIDSSHNIFIDIIFSYWLIGLGVFVSYIVNSWKNMSPTNKSILILGLLFFSLNVIVIAPMLLIIYVLSYQKNIPEKSQE